jgi:hypothetical protein
MARPRPAAISSATRNGCALRDGCAADGQARSSTSGHSTRSCCRGECRSSCSDRVMRYAAGRIEPGRV